MNTISQKEKENQLNQIANGEKKNCVIRKEMKERELNIKGVYRK